MSNQLGKDRTMTTEWLEATATGTMNTVTSTVTGALETAWATAATYTSAVPAWAWAVIALAMVGMFAYARLARRETIHVMDFSTYIGADNLILRRNGRPQFRKKR